MGWIRLSMQDQLCLIAAKKRNFKTDAAGCDPVDEGGTALG
jgi:hypothetical protein